MSKLTNGIVATLLAATASAQTTTRVNLGPGGVQANGSSAYTGTADNGAVAFTSDATNLVAGDTNGVRDVFVRTPQGSTLRVSVSSSGIQGNGTSGTNHYNGSIAISPTGRYVAFDSEATNLVASDSNGFADVFLRDVQANTTVRVSVATGGGGGQANQLSRVTSQAISSDGRYVVFSSSASTLVPGVTNGWQNLFVRDLVTSQTTCVSLGVGGIQSNGDSERASITPDGRYVVFQSNASNLVTNDTNLNTDVFLHDRQTGTTERVNPLSFLSTGGGSVSADGRFVAFATSNSLVPGDTNAQTDIYVSDRINGTLERVSVDSAGGQSSGGGCGDAWISASGAVVGFTSDFTTLVTPDTNGTTDVFVHNRVNGNTQRVTNSTAGVQGTGFNYNGTMSPNGLYSAFVSLSTNLVTGDTNGVQDVFLRTLSLPPPPNDDCATPELISGTGVFPFDTTAATTTLLPNYPVGCCVYSTTNDVWFLWTSTFSGDAEISTCGQAIPLTQVAVYTGNSCPSGPPVDCSGAVCGRQSFVRFPASAGASYMIRVGSFQASPSQPAEFGSGTLTIAQMSNGACTPFDDGHTENAVGGTDANVAWLQRFGTNGEASTVTAVMTAWGSAQHPTSNPANGSPAQVGIWDDPNDDGNPDDLVLLQLVDTVVTGSGTDTLQSVPLLTPVTVSGQYFVGAGMSCSSFIYPAPYDQSTPLAYRGRSYFVEGPLGPINLGSLVASGPLSQNCGPSFGGTYLLRPACGASIVFCMPGQDGVIACPCSNPGQPGRGCQNSSGTGGAVLNLSGNATLAADTLVFTTAGEKPTALSVLLQGSTRLLAGAVYGQGVRCTAGILKRLYTKSAVAGSITAPVAGDPSVSSKSASLGDPLTPGKTRYYQVYYRDPVVQGGCPVNASFNLTQGHIVTWI